MRKKYIILFLILIFISIFFSLTIDFWISLMPKCFIHEAFGIYCPGCGATRAVYALSRGHILTALKYNVGLVSLVAIILIWFAEKIFNKKILPTRLSFWIVFIIILFIYYIARNFTSFPNAL